jgi:hypothetical protein
MEGTRFSIPFDPMLEVSRVFEWSRLESELMASAYESIVPAGRSLRPQRLRAGHEPAGDRAGASGECRHGSSTGA